MVFKKSAKFYYFRSFGCWVDFAASLEHLHRNWNCQHQRSRISATRNECEQTATWVFEKCKYLVPKSEFLQPFRPLILDGLLLGLLVGGLADPPARGRHQRPRRPFFSLQIILTRLAEKNAAWVGQWHTSCWHIPIKAQQYIRWPINHVGPLRHNPT